MVLPEPSLPCRIARDVGPIVVEEVALNIGFAWPTEERELVRPKIWVEILDVWTGAHVPLPGRREGQEIFPKCRLVWSPVRPKFAPLLPKRAKSILMGDGILNDEGLKALRVREYPTGPP